MYKINLFDKISLVLVLIGAVNWGLIGLLNFNLVTYLCFNIAPIIRVIYIIIALSGINMLAVILRCHFLIKK